MLVSITKTACEPFAAVIGGYLCVLVSPLFFVVCVGHYLDDDSRAEREAFHECLALGQIMHLGCAVCEFFENFLIAVVKILSKNGNIY